MRAALAAHDEALREDQEIYAGYGAHSGFCSATFPDVFGALWGQNGGQTKQWRGSYLVPRGRSSSESSAAAG